MVHSVSVLEGQILIMTALVLSTLFRPEKSHDDVNAYQKSRTLLLLSSLTMRLKVSIIEMLSICQVEAHEIGRFKLLVSYRFLGHFEAVDYPPLSYDQ